MERDNYYSVFERIDDMRNILVTNNSFTRKQIEEKYKISRATFCRDLDFLRNRLKLEIKYKKGRYTL